MIHFYWRGSVPSQESEHVFMCWGYRVLSLSTIYNMEFCLQFGIFFSVWFHYSYF